MDIVYAVTNTVVAMPDGSRITVHAGTHWSAEDPVVLRQPGIFSTDPKHGLNYSTTSPPIETASADPGERRTANRPVPGPRRA